MRTDIACTVREEQYVNKEGKETNIVPADDFVCEEDFLHVWVPDVIRALILDHLEK